jgi:hypothetical protein
MPLPEGVQPGIRELLFSRGRVIFFLVAIVFELAIFFAATVVPIDRSTQQNLTQAANNLRNLTDTSPPLVTMRLIFSNNLRVALVEMVPGLGPIVLAASIFTTGQLLQVVSIAAGYPSILVSIFLFAFPYTIIELSAYPLAVVSGTMLLVAWRRRTLRKEIRVFLWELVGVVAVLLLAAAMETATLLSATLGILLWLPMVFLAVLFALGRGRKGAR